MKKYVISLDSATQRQQHIEEQFKKFNVDFEFFSAIRADEVETVARDLNVSLEQTILSPNEIACLLSHVSIWKKMIDEDTSYACIFEDDIYLGENSDYYLNNTNEWAPKDFDIVRFEVFNKKILVKSKPILLEVGKRRLEKLYAKHTGCAGYMLTIETAKKLLNMIQCYKPLIPVDHIVFGDFLYQYEANIYQFFPALCIQSQHKKDVNTLASHLEINRAINNLLVQNKNENKSKKVTRELRRLKKQFNSMATKAKLKAKGVRELKIYYK